MLLGISHRCYRVARDGYEPGHLDAAEITPGTQRDVRMYALLCSFCAVGGNRTSHKAMCINILQLVSIWN
jgi:hypothetical protein